MTDRVKLVVFDWAGTVVDFGCRAPAGAFIEAFRAAGVPVTAAEARAPMGVHKKDHVRAMLGEPALAARWHAARGVGWTEADVNTLYDAVTPLQIAAAAERAELIPGTLDAVAELRAGGVKIAGTTGYFAAAADVCYTSATRQGYTPDFVICADEVPAGRPAPWMLLRVMQALGVYPPSAVVKVGDTPADIGEARNAGAWAVGVVDGSNGVGLSLAEFGALTPGERAIRRAHAAAGLWAAGAQFVVAGPADVPGVVREVERRLRRGERA